MDLESKKMEELMDNFKSINDYIENLGFPGDYPFTRGITPNMYRGKTWTMRQYSGYGDAAHTNKRFKYLLANGQTGLSVAFDLPTQMGYACDDIESAGEVGKVGVSINTLQDMEDLFCDIPLDKVSVSMTINATAIIILAMYVALAQKKKINLSNLRGTVQNDILKEYIARGTYIFPPKESLQLVIDVIKYCNEFLPNFNGISISGYHIREAGSTASQELAFTFSNAITYVENIIKTGIHVDTFAPRLSFFFNVHNNFLEEISKFRAARRIWAKIMRDRFGAQKKESMLLRFHTQTAGCSLSANQPKNNIGRVTLQALAAILGGTQSLHTNSFDEALGLPTEESSLIALRTQQIIKEESRVINTIDPLAGSYIIEESTNELEKNVLNYLNEIDKMGGSIACIENGFIKNEIEKSAYAYQKSIENNERNIVGVNKYKTNEIKKIKILKINPETEKKQLQKLKQIKNARDNKKVVSSLKTLNEKAITQNINLFPYVLDCVKNYCTIGEITKSLSAVFGKYDKNR
jgi:methylmalonyl-CoA mutase N-terminal domain/subunit